MIHGSDSSHLRAAGAGDPRNQKNRKNCTETMTEKCA